MSNQQEKLDYQFAETGGGEEVGFNEAVVTSFKGHLAYHLARESIQNVIDAAVEFPAKAEFELLRIRAKELPNPDRLIEVFTACRDYFAKNSQSVDFFQKAQDKFKHNDFVPVLRIRDYNTRGLTGGDENREGDYYNFLKSSGASSKRSGSGGSFGLGKGAYFAASSLHAIFVSSIYDKSSYVFQGKLRLVTHVRNGKKFQHTGSFGLSGQKPVRTPNLIPNLFKRKEQGTDIFIAGFYEDNGWKEQIIKSVLNNFWLAILWGKLEVRADDLNITKDNLQKLMFKYFSEEENDTEENPNPLPVFLAYTDEHHHITFEDTLPTLGHVGLYLLLKENYYRKISYFRLTGMEIQKRLHQVPVGYAGVFICDNDDGNEILRMMENPQHNKWDPHNAREKTQEIFEKAKRADKELREFIKKSLKSIFEAKGAESLNVPGLEKYLYLIDEEQEKFAGYNASGNFLSDVSEQETGSEIGAEDEEAGAETIKPIKVIKENTRVTRKGKKKRISKRGRGGGVIDRLPDVGEEDSDIEGKILTDVETRSFAVRKAPNETKHIIVIKGKPNLKLNLAVTAGTEDSFEKIDIVSATDESGKKLKVKGNHIYGLELNSNGLLKLTTSFGAAERYALHIIAYENR